MIIKQYKAGQLAKTVVAKTDIPMTWIEAVNAAFDNTLSGQHCIEAAHPSEDRYEFYLLGACSHSVPVKGTQFARMYKKVFNVATGDVCTEVYYYGYAFDVPSDLQPQASTLYAPAVMTSLLYGADRQLLERSFYLFRGRGIEPEFDRVAAVMGFTESNAEKGAVKVNFDGDTPIEPCYYVWEH